MVEAPHSLTDEEELIDGNFQQTGHKILLQLVETGYLTFLQETHTIITLEVISKE